MLSASLPRAWRVVSLDSYAPLSVRLVQAAVRPGWSMASEALKLLPGPCVEIAQDPNGPVEDLPTAREGRGEVVES